MPTPQVLTATFLLRLYPVLDGQGLLWMALLEALCLAGIACQCCRSRQSLRWRESFGAAWLASISVGGRAAPLLKAALAGGGPAGTGGVHCPAAALIFASNVCVQLLAWAKAVRWW